MNSMRTTLFISILLLTSSCSNTRDDVNDNTSTKVLQEQFDLKGRITKRIVTGRIPGEDIYLTISKYDTSEKVIEEWGAKPYGKKFRTEFKYDTNNQLVEKWNYTFFAGDDFENYKDELYSLPDTLANFNGEVNSKIFLTFNNHENVVIEHYYFLNYDSFANKSVFKLSEIDTFEIIDFIH